MTARSANNISKDTPPAQLPPVAWSTRKARAARQPVSPLIAELGGGRILFTGAVYRFAYQTVEGFTVGDVYIQGQDAYQGSEYHIWFKNEHMIA